MSAINELKNKRKSNYYLLIFIIYLLNLINLMTYLIVIIN
jgi:hypothetical protein